MIYQLFRHLIVKVCQERQIFVIKGEDRPGKASIYIIGGGFVPWRAFCTMRGDLIAMRQIYAMKGRYMP